MPKGKRRKNTTDKSGAFVSEYVAFYNSFFKNMAQTVEFLEGIQTKYPKEYDVIVKFQHEPFTLREYVSTLPSENQAVLFNMLYTAGILGNKLNNVAIMSPTEKKKLVIELKEFVEYLNKVTAKKR